MSNKVTQLLKKMRDELKGMKPEEVSALYCDSNDTDPAIVSSYAQMERMILNEGRHFICTAETLPITGTVNSNSEIAVDSNESYALAA